MNFKFLFFLALSFTFSSLWGFDNGIEVTGKVVEGNSQRPIEFATVVIADKNTQKTITGVTTDLDGSFIVETNENEFYVEISFLGFSTKVIQDVEVINGKVDLGIIFLSEDGEILDEIIVRADKSTTEFKLDKRVFNVGQDLSNTGASVLEVLNNVPSVNVSIEGEITLRGSGGVQILINGKPSVLASEQGNALGSITADMIEKIEVITNPSAKYDAEGTSGIINIVIKKEERKGINGSVSVNTGIPNNHSVGLSINRRTEKFNLFSQVGMGYRELPRDQRNRNVNLSTVTSILSEGRNYRNETFYNVILGTDYIINPKNIITLSGNFAYEIEDQPSETTFRYPDETGRIISEWNRTETTEATNPKYQYELQYKREFEDSKDHMLLFSALGNFFGKDQSSQFFNSNITGNEAAFDQETETNFKEAKYTFILDYTKPFNDNWTVETGAQYVSNNVSNDFAVTDLIDGEWIPNINLTNLFEYDQDVLGVYGTGAYEDDKWGVKLGLRVENTNLSTLLVNTDENNDQNFTNLFPTLHTSFKLTERISLQGGYSRRIYRPRLWDLNPFFNIRNNFSIRTGNPNLLPELTDSYEISSIYVFDKTSLNVSLYYRLTNDVIERISSFRDNVNTVMPMNIGTNDTYGLELNGKVYAAKWLSLNGDFNYNYFNRQGTFEGTSFDFAADQWSTKVTAKFALPADFDVEITGQHRSGVQTVQGNVSSNTFADLGIRKKILDGKGIFSLSVRDLFVSRFWESESSQGDFYAYSWGRRGRFVSLGFSYGFGKGEAMEYSGRRRR